MKFLITGLGSIGRRHLDNLVQLGENDIILYRTGKGTQGDKEEIGFPVIRDLSVALAEKPDAVIISNPTALHADAAIQAAKENIHIFWEKPISHTIDSLMPFEEILKISKSRVFVGYQFRFNAGLRKIRDMLNTNLVGRPLSFESRWGEYLPDWHPNEDYRVSYAGRSDMGGGVVLTLSHPIDYLRWIFGEVAELSAETGNKSDLELDCEDFTNVSFQFRDGLKGSMHLDYYSRPKVHDLVIHCENGVLTWDYLTNVVVYKRTDGELENFPPPQGYERNQMYLDEMAHFIDVCKNGVEPLCSYADGKKALNIALGILQSGRYKERVIFED